MGSNTLEAAARLSFKQWSEGHGTGGCSGMDGGDGALTTTAANRGSNGEDDQSSLGTLVGERCCNAGDFNASSSPAFASFEGKGGAGITVKTAAAAPTSDFGVTVAARQRGGGFVGAGGVGSEASVATSAAAPAFIEPDRPLGRLSCTLVQLSTRCVRTDERRGVSRACASPTRFTSSSGCCRWYLGGCGPQFGIWYAIVSPQTCISLGSLSFCCWTRFEGMSTFWVPTSPAPPNWIVTSAPNLPSVWHLYR